MTVVAQENGQQAIESFREHQPDITLMDRECHNWEESKPSTRFVLSLNLPELSFSPTTATKISIEGLHSGAQGYLLKDAKPNELLNAIRTVHHGQQYIPPDVKRKTGAAIE